MDLPERGRSRRGGAWCEEIGLVFDAVNDNLPENVSRYKNNCRKVNADYYIDDRNFPLSLREERDA